MVNQRISLKDVSISITGGGRDGDFVVGGCEELTCTVNADDTPAHEGGSYLPVEIVDGAITINGNITRAFVDVDLLNDLFPSTGDNVGVKPSFTLSGEIVSGKTPGRTISITGAKFNSIDISGLTLTDYAKNSLPFNATGWKFS